VIRLLLALVPLFLVSCLGVQEKTAGHNLAEGAGDYIDSPAGQAKIDAAVERGVTKGIATAKIELKAELTDLKTELKSDWHAEVETAKTAAANGTATWWQYLLIVLGGGSGSVTVWSVVDRVLHGKRHAAKS